MKRPDKDPHITGTKHRPGRSVGLQGKAIRDFCSYLSLKAPDTRKGRSQGQAKHLKAGASVLNSWPCLSWQEPHGKTTFFGSLWAIYRALGISLRF